MAGHQKFNMSDISADFVLRHLLSRIEWAAGQGAEYVIEAYDQVLIRKALVAPPVPAPGYRMLNDGEIIRRGDELFTSEGWSPVIDMVVGWTVRGFSVRRPVHQAGDNGYRMLLPGEIIEAGDEVLFSNGWSPANGWGNGIAIGLQAPDGFSVRRPISATPCDSMQYYSLAPSDLIEDGDELLVPGWNYDWVKCGAYIIGDMAAGRSIRRLLPGCPYPGADYKVYPKGYLLGAKLRDGDAAWDGHNWLPLQSVIDNGGYLDRVLENSFVRRKKIYQ